MSSILSTLVLALALSAPSTGSLPSSLSAAQVQTATGTLRVKVLDSTGATVQGAKVALIRDGRVTREQTTNADGIARFDDVVVGAFRVRARKHGVGAGRAAGDIAASATTERSVTLQPRHSKK